MASVTVPLATLAGGATRTVNSPKGRQPTLPRDATTGVLSLPGWCGVGG